MSTIRPDAARFLRQERAFRLGALLTESSHPRTATLSQTIGQNTEDGIRMLQSVDEDIPPAVERVFASDEFRRLVDALRRAIASGRRVFFTGCGATGRLAILLEAAWRRFWQDLGRQHPQIRAKLPRLEESTRSVMAGGDYALVRSVEGFEDFPDFGRYQLARADVGPNDVVVAITEGGETSFVIGTAWKGLDAGARVFFVYNNPTELLRHHVERSRRVIEEDRITKLDLTTGPMAVAGSTRMQATTAELLVVGAALETALVSILRDHLSPAELEALGIAGHAPQPYHGRFAALLGQLRQPANVQVLGRLARFEETVYRRHGLVTYLADAFLLDVLTDTTERSPTFKLPPFRKGDDTVSAPSWAFVKNPRLPTRAAWHDVFQRRPRGLDWDPATYARLNAPEALRHDPPQLDNAEIYRFRIGNEPDPSRHAAEDSALAMILVGGEVGRLTAAGHPFPAGFQRQAADFQRTAAICVGPRAGDLEVDHRFHLRCELPPSPLGLWAHLAAKLVLNTISTATMARLGRLVGNWMVWVDTTNKKLIDRGIRLIVELTGASYEQACHLLHEAMEEVGRQDRRTHDAPSPVALVIERLGAKDGDRSS